MMKILSSIPLINFSVLLSYSINGAFILALSLFSSTLYASDISKYDISGVKLGMTHHEAMIIFGFEDGVKNNTRIYNGKVKNKRFKLKNGELYQINMLRGFGDSYIEIKFDHNKQAYKVEKKYYFDVLPDISKIKSKLTNKYGPFDKTTKVYDNDGYAEQYCWGFCEVVSSENLFNSKLKGSEISGIPETYQLNVTFFNWINSSNKKEISLKIKLEDPERKNHNEEWSSKQNKLYELKQKRKASEIDF